MLLNNTWHYFTNNIDMLLYYFLTVVNFSIATVSLFMIVKLYWTYNIAERWIVYILYALATVLCIIILQIRGLISHNLDWHPKLFTIIVGMSKLYFVHCLKFSSIKKA